MIPVLGDTSIVANPRFPTAAILLWLQEIKTHGNTASSDDITTILCRTASLEADGKGRGGLGADMERRAQNTQNAHMMPIP
jgi:hypothetical protein